jgi:heterodisulfide reductase subunit A-like polyferredoxin
MSTRGSRRRTFLKTLGLGAAALSIRLALAAGEAAGESRPLPVRSALDGMQVDVLVVGGGPAGIGASLASARKGAKTLRVENHSFFGGVAAWCLGMPINQVRPGRKPRSQVHELVVRALNAKPVRLTIAGK